MFSKVQSLNELKSATMVSASVFTSSLACFVNGI